MKKSWQSLLAAATLTAIPLCVSAPARALDGATLTYGASDSSNASVNLYRASLQWDWKKRWLPMGGWHLNGYWELGGSYWDNNTAPALRTHDNLFELGATPVFRIEQDNISGFSPFFELAVGVHYLSETSVSTQRVFGSHFSFGDHLGGGVRLGDHGQYEIGYRYQHFSNAGIKEPNQGINFHEIRFEYHFQ